MIVRTGRRIPGVTPVGGVHAPDLGRPHGRRRRVRGQANGARAKGESEAAFRTERIERRVCRAVAEFAFRHAERTRAKVFGGPKYTVSPIYEGMLKEEMDAAAARHPEVPLRAASDRRDVRAAAGLGRRPDGHSRAQPRRRHPERLRAAAVRIDRRLGVARRRVRRRVRSARAHGRGGARNRTRPLRQEHRQPARDDPRRGGAAHPHGRPAKRRRPGARSARRASRPSPPASARPISAGTSRRPSFTDEVIRRTRQKLEVWSALADV